jgi:hypothetical protein
MPSVRQFDQVRIIGMPLDQAYVNSLGQYLFELSHRHAAVTCNVVGPTPRDGSFSREFSERDDETIYEAEAGVVMD